MEPVTALIVGAALAVLWIGLALWIGCNVTKGDWRHELRGMLAYLLGHRAPPD
jgi:hypothetical protein